MQVYTGPFFIFLKPPKHQISTILACNTKRGKWVVFRISSYRSNETNRIIFLLVCWSPEFIGVSPIYPFVDTFISL